MKKVNIGSTAKEITVIGNTEVASYVVADINDKYVYLKPTEGMKNKAKAYPRKLKTLAGKSTVCVGIKDKDNYIVF